MKKICIFGGTFDPPHLAHVEIVEQIQAQLSIDKIIVMPCGIPVHKQYAGAAKHRFEMCRLAFDGMKNVLVSNFEIKKKQKSYSVYTLKHFRRKNRNAELFFAIGSDSLEDFPNWKQPELIARLAKIIVIPRANHDFKKSKQFFEKTYKTKLTVLQGEPINVSATELRIMTQFGLDTQQFLSKPVSDFIRENSLYSRYSEICQKAKKYLKSSRLTHTVYTAHEGLKLAKITGADSEKVFVACVLHDVGKNITPNQWNKFDFSNDENLSDSIVHAALGKQMAIKEFGITDETVLNAIRFHTTGRPEMSLEEQIVFAADIVEISRPGMEELRRKVETDFEQGFLSCLKNSYNFAVSKVGAENVDPLTKKTIAYYRKKWKEKNAKPKIHSTDV